VNNQIITIIIPTHNEEKNLPKLFLSLKKLDYPKNKLEIIVIDGNSSDKTVKIAKKYGAKVYQNPAQIRGAGCKIGVEKAQGEYIAFTDADCIVSKNWLKGLLREFTNSKIASVGGPNITPKNDTKTAKAIGAATLFLTRPGARYGFQGTKIQEIFHNPGCNVMYRKKAILDVENFNPTLITCEDEELDYRIIKKGYKILFTPNVVVDHYRRPTYKKILIQAFRYAVGRAQAIKMHPKMARWFHHIPTLLLSVYIFILISPLTPIIKVLPLIIFCFGLLGASFFLQIKDKNAPHYVYLNTFLAWFFGWSIGYIAGFIFYPVSPVEKES
jgi:cellulose synthase/poly-beta-1,6-N-acetylglucosamine synthase-like glycosyltransferase